MGKYKNLRGDDMSKTMLKEPKGGERIAKAGEMLRESEGKYRTLTESSLTGIFIHQDRKYVFVNDRFARIHGYTAQELLGKEHLTLIHPDDREIVKDALESCHSNEISTNLYARYIQKNQDVKYAHIICNAGQDNIQNKGWITGTWMLQSVGWQRNNIRISCARRLMDFL